VDKARRKENQSEPEDLEEKGEKTLYIKNKNH